MSTARSGGPWTLLGAVAPGLTFAWLLAFGHFVRGEFPWLRTPWSAPWPVFVIALCGGIGLVGTVGDYRYHRAGPRVLVGAPEHKSHVLALATGGVPLAVVMAFATFDARPARFTAAAMLLAIYVTLMVAYDEFVFHRRRRCARREQTLHLLSTLGNGGAFLAWSHWVFAMGVRS